MKRTKNESASVVTRERVLQYLRTRYESIADLTPERIIRAEQDFDAGWLRAFSVLSNTLIETDDVLKGVVGKREKGPAVRGWEIATVDDSDEAKRDAERLKYFYDNLTVTNAVDENERGGVGLMIRQMQRAVGLKYACHEIVWEPTSKGVTATLRSVPLWFFENTLGRLRYLPSEGSVYGVDLEDGGWMVTVGDHLMRACARACLYKRLPTRDWLVYCARHGMPGIAGHTSAAKGSAAWNEMETALAAFAAEFAVVLSKDATIDKIDMSSSGPLPYPQLIERMDRAMAALWRGNDLSTMSRGGDASGASIQGEETEILVASDATMVSEASNWYLDRHVIYLTTGEDRKPLAYFTIKGLSRQNIEQDLKVDAQLHEMGVETSKQDLRERYGRRAPTDEADTVRTAQVAPLAPLAPAPQVEAANARPVLRATGRPRIEAANGDVPGHPFRGNQHTDGFSTGAIAELASSGHISPDSLSASEWLTGQETGDRSALEAKGFLYLTKDQDFAEQYSNQDLSRTHLVRIKEGAKTFDVGNKQQVDDVVNRMFSDHEAGSLPSGVRDMVDTAITEAGDDQGAAKKRIAAELSPRQIRDESVYDSGDLQQYLWDSHNFQVVEFKDRDTALLFDVTASESETLANLKYRASKIEAANTQASPGADVPAIGQFLATAKLQIAEAASADLLPLARALAALMKAADDADMSDADYRAALEKFYTVDMPKLSMQVLKSEAAAKALSDLFAASFVNGLADGVEATKGAQ